MGGGWGVHGGVNEGVDDSVNGGWLGLCIVV